MVVRIAFGGDGDETASAKAGYSDLERYWGHGDGEAAEVQVDHRGRELEWASKAVVRPIPVGQ